MKSGITSIGFLDGIVKRSKPNAAKVLDAVIGCSILMFIFERPAHAYIDPGAGTMLWQALAGIFAGAVFYGSKLLARIRGGRDHRDEK